MQKAKKRRALHEIMTPSFWRTHHIIPAFIALLGLGMALGIAHFSTLQPYKALATASDNVMGWAWASNASWFSLNDINPTACGSGSCGTYGVNLDPSISPQEDGNNGHTLNGFAWSDGIGFVCFGRSCEIAACHPPYHPPAPATGYFAYVDPISDAAPKKVHGWAAICNQKAEGSGLISLNCLDTGLGTCHEPEQAGDLNYRVVYNPSNKNFFVDPYNGNTAMSQGVSFGWNGNTDATGIGYVSFFPPQLGGGVYADGMHLVLPPETLCSDTKDNDLNGKTDCEDPNCSATAGCQEINAFGATPQQQYLACHDTVDNNTPINNMIDCAGFGGKPADPSCVGADVCKPEAICNDSTDNDGDGLTDCNDHPDCDTAANCMPESLCADTLDNDSDGAIDCADSDCSLDPSCSVQPDCTDTPACQLLPAGSQAKKDCCCNDNDTNGGHPLDCLDPICVTNAPKICSAWSKVETGNIYAGGGISGTQAPKATNVSNATYCLRSDNKTIEWTSAANCKEESAGTIDLPTYQTGYRNKLGFLDLQGIRSGRYGKVVALQLTDPLPANLDGKIYRVTLGTYTLNATQFLNGAAPINRGNGLLLLDGADLSIAGDIKYSSLAVSGGLRNLASFGIIAVKDLTGTGGNIYIEPNVEVVSGTMFAEGNITTKASLTPPDMNLKMFGILVARQFKLLRDNQDPTIPAEEIIFDGRAVANPPPGMQDISRSLPRADFNY